MPIWPGNLSEQVNSLADMRALSTPPQVIELTGYATPGDGGGGTFVYLGSGATPGDISLGGDDDGGFHIVSANGDIWQRQSDVVTPQMFGAFPSTTTAAARAASDLSATIQRAIDFWIYPNATAFPGLGYGGTTLRSRRFELPFGLYPCESTIELDFSSYGDEPTHGYDYMAYYVPGDIQMLGAIWTPYATDITAIRLRSHIILGRTSIHLNAYKDVHWTLVTDPPENGRKKWDYGTYPNIYADDTCLRTWASGTTYYRDEDVKYVSAGVTYVLHCTATGETASATPADLTGSSFTDGGTFYCLGTSRLANGKNMDDVLMDTDDVGIHVAVLVNADQVKLSAANYTIGVRVQPREVGGVAWSKLEIPRAPGCMAGLVLGSYNGHRITELGGRLALEDFPVGGIVWETAYPKSESGFLPAATQWTNGGSGFVENDLIYYSINYPLGTTQRWIWRVSSVTTGTLGSTAPTASECTTTPWTSGGVTMVCIGSKYGTYHVYDGGGESDPLNWSEAPAAYQQKLLGGVGWSNDNEINARYIIPWWQGSSTISSDKSLYGVVFTGAYAVNNNHVEMVDMTPTQFGSTWALKEAYEVLLYSGCQNGFHVRQEDPSYAGAVKAVRRHHDVRPANNLVTSGRNPVLYTSTTYNRQRGGGNGNVLAGPLWEMDSVAEYEVDFSRSFCWSGYQNIASRDLAIAKSSATGSMDWVRMAVATGTGAGSTEIVGYNAADDSWDFYASYLPMVVVDLSSDYTGTSIIRITPRFGDASFTTARWARWYAYPLEEDGITMISPSLIPDTSFGTGTYASHALINEIANGVSYSRPLQDSTYGFIYATGYSYNPYQINLAVHPLVKKVAVGLRCRHIRGFNVQVIGGVDVRIYSPVAGGYKAAYSSTDVAVVDAVPEKGIVWAPAVFKYRDGTGTYFYADANVDEGHPYYCTSGEMTGLTPGTNRQWGHDGAAQGSATIGEWNGATWTTIATNAYFLTPSDFTLRECV